MSAGHGRPFLGSPDNSDPDEIIYASEANIVSPGVSPVPTQLDAGFQTNMIVASVAASNSNNGRSSPVGYASNTNSDSLQPTYKKKLLNPKPKSDVGVQTDQALSEEAGGYTAEPTNMKKDQLIGKDNSFNMVDQWVKEISEKRYKSLKKIVTILNKQIEDEFIGKEDLLKIRAFYKWTTYNIRYFGL